MIKITHISDTHGKEPLLTGGDILIHSGDLTTHGYKSQIIKQLNYLHNQLDKYKHIVIIAGNHDFWAESHPNEFKEACIEAGILSLMNESVKVMDLKIFGSPDTPWFNDWAFNRTEDELKVIYEQIPSDTDILITHGPARGILDKTYLNQHVGSTSLKNKIKTLNLVLHLFGHIHESYGATIIEPTVFVNSGTKVCNILLDGTEVSWEFQ